MALSVFLLKTVIFIFICKSDIVISLENQNDTDSYQFSCGIGWHYHDKYCYVLKLFKKNWQDAEEKCGLLGGTLASIHSATQNDFMVNLQRIERARTSWIGGYYPLDGLIMRWSDESNVDYRNFENTQRKKRPNQCVSVVYNEWENRPCKMKKKFICQKNATLSKDNSTDDSQASLSDDDSEGSTFFLVIFDVLTVMIIIGVVVGVICYRRFWKKKERLQSSAVFSKDSTPDSMRTNKLSTEDIINDLDQENSAYLIRKDFN